MNKETRLWAHLREFLHQVEVRSLTLRMGSIIPWVRSWTEEKVKVS